MRSFGAAMLVSLLGGCSLALDGLSGAGDGSAPATSTSATASAAPSGSPSSGAAPSGSTSSAPTSTADGGADAGPPIPSCGVLPSGQTLVKDHDIPSCNGTYDLVMQSDGNLVLYDQAGPIWATNTYDSGAWYAVMQADGDLILTDENKSQQVWHSGTSVAGAYVQVTDDGQIYIVAGGNRVWSGIAP